VFFVHSGRGLAKLDQTGKLTYVHQSKGGHWLCLDPNGSFSRTQPKYFERVTPEGVRPAIIFADGGAPIAVCGDGNLYYASNWAGGDEHAPGGLTVSRLSPDGKLSHVSPSLKETLAKLDEGVTGLAAGPAGLLYVASPSSIFKLKLDGTVTPLARPAAVADCDEDLPPNWRAPGFRGLDVAADGTVYAAATGCRCVVKIASDGKVSAVLKSERPWNPTGVALRAGDIYVLEWTHANGGANDGWRPRVRKITRDGTVTLLMEIKEEVKR
jgi:sugar lactone lactonase YvrE